MLDDVGWCGMMLDDVGWCWIIFLINLELASLWPGDWILLTIHHLWDAHPAGAGEGRKSLMFPRGSKNLLSHLNVQKTKCWIHTSKTMRISAKSRPFFSGCLGTHRTHPQRHEMLLSGDFTYGSHGPFTLMMNMMICLLENGDFQFATSNYQRVNPQNVHLLGGAGPTLQMGETS